MKIVLVTDSTSDLTPEQALRWKVTVVPLYVLFKDRSFIDQKEIRPADIFEGMRAGAQPPSTSQPSPKDFEDVYRRILEEHPEQPVHILSLHVSTKLSGTVQSATLAASNFPGKVTVFDSFSASAGLGMMVGRAAEMIDQERDLGSILAELERIKTDYAVRFTVATLEFLKRNGRIGGAQALLGGLLGIKPVLTLHEGRVEPAGRARGDKKALEDIVTAFRKWAEGRRSIRVFFIYTADRAAVSQLREAILNSGLPVEEGYTSELGAVVATHVGPNAYGFFAYSL